MARRRFKMARRSKTASRRSFKRSRRSSSGNSTMDMMIPAAIYGAARGPVANMISGLSSKLPFGQYNDEVAMAGVSYALKKFAPMSLAKKVGQVGLIVETASAVSGATAGMIGSSTTSSSDQQSW